MTAFAWSAARHGSGKDTPNGSMKPCVFRSSSLSALTMALLMHSLAVTKGRLRFFMPTQLLDSTYAARAIRPLLGSVTDLIGRASGEQCVLLRRGPIPNRLPYRLGKPRNGESCGRLGLSAGGIERGAKGGYWGDYLHSLNHSFYIVQFPASCFPQYVHLQIPANCPCIRKRAYRC